VLESFIKWAGNFDNLIGGLLPALIAIFFSVLLTIREESSFFENKLHRFIFWIGSTCVTFIASIWTIVYVDSSNVKNITLTMPHIIPSNEIGRIESFYLSIPSIVFINYLLLIFYYQRSKKDYYINAKEGYVLTYSSLLVVDYIHMKINDLANTVNGIGGIGGGGYRDTLLVVPFAAYLFLTLLMYLRKIENERYRNNRESSKSS